MRKVNRVLRTGLVCALLISSLAACTAEVGAVVGLMKDENGDVYAVGAACSGYIDSVAVTDANLETVFASQDFDERIESAGTVLLARRSDVQELTMGDEISVLIGNTTDGRWEAVGPEFTERDLDEVEIGQVWFMGWSEEAREVVNLSVPLDDFPSEGCAEMNELVFED